MAALQQALKQRKIIYRGREAFQADQGGYVFSMVWRIK
jgi:hypothetical protein